MIETGRYTPRAQQVILEAQKEAKRMNQTFTGTEHLLLAIMRIDAGIAVNVLKKLGLSYEQVHTAVEKERTPEE
jgi:ATP-dependent Clp protease ATP-binding subunit ClpC